MPRVKVLNDKERCAIKYVQLMAGYARNLAKIADEYTEVRAQLGLHAIDYERDGSRSAYEDRKPEMLDKLARVLQKLESSVALRQRDYETALDLFLSSVDSEIAWLHYGQRLKWREICESVHYEKTRAQELERIGLMRIYEGMPLEYRDRCGNHCI